MKTSTTDVRVVIEKTQAGARVTVPNLRGGTHTVELRGAKAEALIKRAAKAGILKK